MSESWRALAACRGREEEADVTFDHPGKVEAVAFGQKYCSTCDVALECLLFAMEMEDGITSSLARHGTYGGLTGAQRAALVKWGRRDCVDCGQKFIARNRAHLRCARCSSSRSTNPGPVREHGTRAGYCQHKRRGEDACQPCLDANNAYDRGRVGIRKERRHQLRGAA